MIHENMEKIASVQFLRGMAALAVVLFHFSSGYLSEENALRQLGRYGTYGVHAFFVISGFILPYALYHGGYKIRYYGKFLVKRLLRLEPAYLFCLFCIILLGYLSAIFLPFGGSKSYSVDWVNLGLHIGYLVPFSASGKWMDPVFWTLAIEFQFYVLLGLLYPLVVAKSHGLKLLFLLLFGASGIFIPSVFFLFHYQYLFITGILVFYQREQLLPKYWSEVLLILVLALMCWQYDWIVALVALFSVLIILYTNVNTKITNFLGEVSYPLYLFHNTIGALLILHTAKHFVEGDLVFSLLILLALAVCLLWSWLVVRFVERPFIRWSKRLRYRA